MACNRHQPKTLSFVRLIVLYDDDMVQKVTGHFMGENRGVSPDSWDLVTYG